MSDYFDQLELQLRAAASQRRHVPWYVRMRLPVRRRGLLLVLAGLVVATPAAVGAASGWFSPGQPDLYHPASATSGLGKVLPTGDRLLPIRVADPAGGPPWGIRLVHTTRDATCIQIGRVQGDQIGALGIDDAWHDDDKFHEIKPNDMLADLCGATDGAGNGFVNQVATNAPANVDVPIYNARRLPAPAHSLRMIFAGLLGPDAKSITYKTPSGQTKSEATSGGVGAYLIVFRQNAHDCGDYKKILSGSDLGCGDGGPLNNAVLHEPTAITSVTYKNGSICEVLDRQCDPVGWVASGQPKLAAKQVATPLRVRVRRYSEAGQPAVQVKVSFIAPQPVTSANSYYTAQLRSPGRSSQGSISEKDIRRGQRVTFTMPVAFYQHGRYHGTIGFVQNVGWKEANVPPLLQRSALTVGKFSFRLPRAK